MDRRRSIQERIDRLSSFLTPERSERLRYVLGRRTRHLVVVLENLMDPHNASACIRSCEACGLQEVQVVEELSPFDASIGVARGTDRWIHLIRNLPAPTERPGGTSLRTLKSLRMRGYRLVAMTPHPAPDRFIPFDALPLDRPIALIFGTEKKGLSRTALSEADVHTLLPMEGFVESYNISVACALAVFNLSGRIRKELEPKIWSLTEEEQEEILLEWTRLSIRRIDKIEAGLCADIMESP